MTTYYISGPMTGKPNYNHAMFCAVEDALLLEFGAFGIDVLNPATNFDGDKTLERVVYMTLDLKQVLLADTIVLLPGWAESEGARREIQVATWTGKKFMEARIADDHIHDDDGSVEGCPGCFPGPRWTFENIDIDATAFCEKRSVRASMLSEATGLVTGDRNNAYGPPWQDFQRSSDGLNAMGYRGPNGRALEPHDTAIMVMMIKISRLTWTPAKRDNWVDIAGYAACGLECALHEEDERKKVVEVIEDAKAEFKAAVSDGWFLKDWGGDDS